MLFPKILIGLLQIYYDTMLFQTKLFHLCIILHRLLQISLETIQIIMGLSIELNELGIFGRSEI